VLFGEGHALELLILHAVLGAALVAASTHLVVWMRGFLRGRFERLRAVRKLAAISVTLFGIAFISGNLIYPTYKIRVRGQYLEEGTAVIRDHRNRETARSLFEERNAPPRVQDDERAPAGGAAAAAPEQSSRNAPAEAYLPRRAVKLARWFEVKEHWVALGLALSVACALLLFACDPRKAGRAVGPTAFGFALCAASAAWLGAIIGLVVAASRSVAGLG